MSNKFKYPVYEPLLAGNEKKYVNECLDSTWISSKGKFVNLFEQKFSEYTKNPYSLTVSNGTVALHLAMLALDIGAGDEVIVPTFTYVASVNCIKYVNAKPVFVDSLETNLQMNPADVEKKITKNTKAIIAVHLYGHACDVETLAKIAKKYNIHLIEDCAEALGTYLNGIHVGNWGIISTYSFFGNKTVTTGEGGMVTTPDKALADKIQKLKGQGLQGNIEYWHDVVGYNFRMTNICAAIGVAQLEKVYEILAKKRKIAEIYRADLSELPVRVHFEDAGCINSFWMCTILVEPEIRQKLRDHLSSNAIETRPGFYPIHTMPMYSDLNDKNDFPIANNLGSAALNLPSSPVLSETDVKFICSKIAEFYK